MFYHEDHKGHEVKNQDNFTIIFVPLRVLCGECENRVFT
jgi:hypothetical protein